MSKRKTRDDDTSQDQRPGEGRYSGIGDQLREVRLRNGGDLAEIAAILRIRLAYLKAIEDGRFDQLPGATYANGFVRSYANYLGLDGEAAVALFRAEAASNADESRLVFPAPLSEAKVPTGRILLLSLVLAGAVYGGWYYMSQGMPPVAELVPPLPDSLAPPPPPPTEAPAQPAPDGAAQGPSNMPATGTASPGAETPAAPAPATTEQPLTEEPDGDVAAASPPPAPGATPAQPPATPELALPAPALPAPAAEPGPAVAAIPPAPPPLPDAAVQPAATGASYGEQGGARVQVRAIADAWVQVRGPGGEALFTRTLKAGDVYNVPPRDDLVLVTGNAGGVELSVDGKSLGKLGQTGQVRRNVSLAAASLLAQPPR